jgi:hypothetical protein
MTAIHQLCLDLDGSLAMRTEIVDEDPYWHGYNGQPDQHNENNATGRVSTYALQSRQPRGVLKAASAGPGKLRRTNASGVTLNKAES